MGSKKANSAMKLASVDPEPKSDESAPSPAAAGAPADAAPKAAPKADDAPDAAAPAASEVKGAAPDEPLAAEATAASTSDADGDRPPPPPRPKPARRISAFTSNLDELRTAFPEAEEDVRRGVLVASSNNLEQAFSGMLAIQDPTIRPAAYVEEQIEGDAKLARRLASSQTHRQRREPRRESRERVNRDVHRDAPRRESQDSGLYAGDDLYDGFQRGFSDTKQAVSSFWGSLKQRISNEVYEDEDDIDRVGAREPPRDQWWPRQSDGQRAGGEAQPPLPPRKPSRPSVARSEAKDAAPKEPKSVNAFGDDPAAQRRQWEPVQASEPEPDAFFIGESDDDDLGSLNEEPSTDGAGGAKDAGTKEAGAKDAGAKDTKTKDAKTEDAKDTSTKDGDVQDSSASKTDTRTPATLEESVGDTTKDDDAETASRQSRRSSTAKDLLNKLRLEAEEKAKPETDKN